MEKEVTHALDFDIEGREVGGLVHADGHAEDTEEIVQAGEAVSTLCVAVPMGSPLREVGVGCYHVTGKM